jgi:hypothetical protein
MCFAEGFLAGPAVNAVGRRAPTVTPCGYAGTAYRRSRVSHEARQERSTSCMQQPANTADRVDASACHAASH